MEPGKEQSMQLIDLPIKKDARLPNKRSMRTPMWFRPVQSKEATLIYYTSDWIIMKCLFFEKFNYYTSINNIA
jgi:hypothetical protein